MTQLQATPSLQAYRDFTRNGCGLEDNPYPLNSADHKEWHLAMVGYLKLYTLSQGTPL